MSDIDSRTKPGLAIVLNAVTPYQINLHRLVAARIPEFTLHVLVTHGAGDFDWNVDIPPDIHLTRFGAEGEHPAESALKNPLWGWRKGGSLIRHMREKNVRAVIINGCYRFASHLRVANYCHRERIPFFVNGDNNIHTEPHFNSLEAFAKRRFYRWWMKRASGVMSMGELGDQFFLKYGADSQRLYRVPYWPDFDSFAHVDPCALDRFQRKFGLDRQRRHLIYSGRLVPEKRVDLLIDAFSQIAGDRPEWNLIIAGDGVLSDELRRRVPGPLRDRIVWTGFLDRGDPALAYRSADVLVLPSDAEQWALVVQEAMAAGLAVVASHVVGAAHELVTDGVNGKIFPAGECDALRQALLEVTRPDRTADYKQQASIALKRYRENVDPVAEIRRALADVGLLTNSSMQPPAVSA